MAIRVQIPAYTDPMMVDRFGVIINVNSAKGVIIAHVRLDNSGKVIKVINADCTEV